MQEECGTTCCQEVSPEDCRRSHVAEIEAAWVALAVDTLAFEEITRDWQGTIPVKAPSKCGATLVLNTTDAAQGFRGQRPKATVHLVNVIGHVIGHHL